MHTWKIEFFTREMATPHFEEVVADELQVHGGALVFLSNNGMGSERIIRVIGPGAYRICWQKK